MGYTDFNDNRANIVNYVLSIIKLEDIQNYTNRLMEFGFNKNYERLDDINFIDFRDSNLNFNIYQSYISNAVAKKFPDVVDIYRGENLKTLKNGDIIYHYSTHQVLERIDQNINDALFRNLKNNKTIQKQYNDFKSEKELKSFNSLPSYYQITMEEIDKDKNTAKKQVEQAYDSDMNNFKAELAKEQTDWINNFNNVISKESETELRNTYETLTKQSKEQSAKQITEKEAKISKELEDERIKKGKEIEDEKQKIAKEIEEEKIKKEEQTKKQEVEDFKLVEQLAVQAIENFRNQIAMQTKSRCSKTSAKQNGLKSRKNIEREVYNEYNDEDDDEDDDDDEDENLSGGNISKMMYQINKRYIMNSPIETPHKQYGNASKKIKSYKMIGGRVKPVRTGLAAIAIDVADLVIDLWGPAIKKFFEDTWNAIVAEFNKPTIQQRERREKEMNIATKKVIAARIVALFKANLVIDADELFTKEADKYEEKFDKEFEAVQNLMYDKLDEHLDKIEDELEQMLNDLQDKLDKDLDDLDDKKEKEIEKIIDDKNKKLDDLEDEKDAKLSEIDAIEAQKREAKKQEMLKKKQEELAAQNSFIIIPKTTSAMTTNQQNQIRHNAVQQQKAKEELVEQGVIAKGSGKKINKRAEIVKNIMSKKGLNMIEASKYVKYHNLY